MTFIEILAVLVILGILAAVAVPRYIDMESNAQKKALSVGIMELNAREHLTWADQAISPSGYIDDLKIFNAINYDIGTKYTWEIGDPKTLGGTLNLKGMSITLSRQISSRSHPAIWEQRP